MRVMKRVDIKIGFECNSFCRFCIQADKRNKFLDKSVKEIEGILKKEKEDCNSVIFTGG